MKDIRIYAIDSSITNIDALLEKILYRYFPDSRKFNFIWDEENPDYVFVRPFIFGNSRLFKKFKRYYSSNRLMVMFGTEMYLPDLNLFDYAIVYDNQSKSGDRICQFPYITYYFGDNPAFLTTSPSVESATDLLRNKSDFCNFIYSNPCAHPFRDEFFYALSEYKTVESLGVHLHNKDIPKGMDREVENWLEESIKLKQKYKFSIAVENAVCPGYVTEKIMSSFAANTIPIYFGDPDIANEFNPESFINCNEYKSIHEIIDRVREIDNSDEEYLKILTKPRQTPKQAEDYKKLWNTYVSFIDNIFEQDISKAKRRPVGTRENIYCQMYFRDNWDLFRKLKKYLHHRVLHKSKHAH